MIRYEHLFFCFFVLFQIADFARFLLIFFCFKIACLFLLLLSYLQALDQSTSEPNPDYVSLLAPNTEEMDTNIMAPVRSNLKQRMICVFLVFVFILILIL